MNNAIETYRFSADFCAPRSVSDPEADIRADEQCPREAAFAAINQRLRL